MSKAIATKSVHPERTKLSTAIKDAEEKGGVEKVDIKKRFTALSTKAAEGTGTTTAVLTPNDEQLERINQFTRSPKTAEEVVAFQTMSCNDLPDRDFDIFVTDCVKGFAELPEPFSPIGKSYMLSHDTRSLPKGRIFGAGTATEGGVTFLTNEVYIPNTDANKEFIEGIDFGINWAVSVGVMLGASACSIPGCDAQSFIWGMWCTNGHDKGAYYDPKSEVTDDWGYPVPTSASDPKGVLCLREFKDPRDFYELSQVYLGAQYFAELSKDPAFGDLVKAASAGDLPIIGLSKAEALKLHVPSAKEPQRLLDARSNGQKVVTDDGVFKWLEGNLLYTFDPETDEDATCLGAATDELKAEFASEDPDDDQETPDEAATEEGVEPSEEETDTEGETPPEGDNDDKNPEDQPMSKKAVLAAATKARMPSVVLEAISEAPDDDGSLLLAFEAAGQMISKFQDEKPELEKRASLGDQYLKTVREEAIDWYVKARRGPNNQDQGVDTKTIERILDAADGDVELMKSLVEEYKSEAQAKFPAAVRRSSFPDDPNERQGEEASGDDASAKSSRVVSRLHG